MKPIFVSIFLAASRVVCGGVFLWASGGKIIDPEKFARQVARYQIIGTQASAMVGVILPWSEFIIGCCLLMRVCKEGAWLGAVILLGCFAAARALVLRKGLSIECGCGVMDGIITPQSLVISIAAFATALGACFAEFRTSAGVSA
jgi:hypothetical protein